MFLKKIARQGDKSNNEIYEAKCKEKWRVLNQAILNNKIAEDKLDKPIDNNVMDSEDMNENRTKLMN